MARNIHPVISEEEFSGIYRTEAANVLDGAFMSDGFIHLLYGIYRHLIDASAHFNLTAITEPSAVVRLHLIDVLIPARMLSERGGISEGTRLLDIGSGAGFPALPIAAASAAGVLPRITVTAIDRTAKKIGYIRNTASALGLDSVCAVTARAEEAAHGELRESFDIVTARAVSAMPVLIEIAAPFVVSGGIFAAMKGHSDGEVQDAARGATVLGLSPAEMAEYRLPSGEGRSLVIYGKEHPTPQEYPRAYAKIISSPL